MTDLGPEESLEDEWQIVVPKVFKVYETLYGILERSGTNLVPQSTDFSALGLAAEYKPAFKYVMAHILKPHWCFCAEPRELYITKAAILARMNNETSVSMFYYCGGGVKCKCPAPVSRK
jgi:hypothetical protein